MLMKRSIFAKLLSLALMLLVLAAAGCAAAEEMLAEDSVELYADGGMAAPMQARFGVGTFEDYIVRQLLAGTTRIDLKTFDLLYTEFKPMYQDVLNKHPELFNDYEITKGKMDDVFLAATGRKMEGGQAK